MGQTTGQHPQGLQLLGLEGLIFQPSPSGDIPGDPFHGHQLALGVVHRRVAVLHPHRMAVLVQPADGLGSLKPLTLNKLFQRWAVVRMDHLQDEAGISIVFRRRVAHHFLHCVTDILEARIRCQPVAVDNIGSVVHQPPVACLGLLQRFLSILPLDHLQLQLLINLA